MKFSELEPWQKLIVLACEKEPGLVDLLRQLVNDANAETAKEEQSDEPKE